MAVLDKFRRRAGMKMDFNDFDRLPMRQLNEIIRKSVRGKDSPMPAPVHRSRRRRSISSSHGVSAYPSSRRRSR